VFSMVPAFVASRSVAAAALAEGARGSSGQTRRLRAILVTVELALAVVFVASALLLARSYAAARGVDPGFDGRGTLMAEVPLDDRRYPTPDRVVLFEHDLLERVATIPGVAAAGLTSSPPLAGRTDQSGASVVGAPDAAGHEAVLSDILTASPGYFRAMAIPLLAGRDFTTDDRASGPAVAIVDDVFVRTSGLDGRAVGRAISIDGGPPLTIVGVVRHARQYAIERDGRQQVYRPFTQATDRALTLALRTNGDPDRLVDPLRSIVADLDPRQPIAHVETMSAVTMAALASRRLQLEVLAGFAAGALLLAALGVYGILSSLVADRTREIGIRLALGATAPQVRGLVVRQALVCAGVGAAIGLVGAVAVSRLEARFLFGVSPRDPWSLALTIALLAAAAALAAYGPARRAARLDPVVALRAE